MTDIPASAEAFYALRDSRTTLCCDRLTYQTVACAVHVSAATTSTATGQMMLVTAANLLSRWCRRVTIVLQPVEAMAQLGMGSGDLGGLILSQMRDADPFGEFEVRATDREPAQVVLAIGADAGLPASPMTVFINASGWLASLSRERPVTLVPDSGTNLLGAIAAACLGVAQAFKLALEVPAALLLREGIFDLLHLAWSESAGDAPWMGSVDLGNILMVGAGSVGSSAAYCLRTTGLPGTLCVVDKDEVKIENFNRSPVFGCETLGHPKAAAIERFLSRSALATTGVPQWWKEFLTERGRAAFDFDVWLPLANEFDVRQAMQHNVPPLMIHASTTRNWGVNHGRHIPGRDDCLADRFPARVVSGEELMCSTGRIQQQERSVDAALPFASLFAGLLVAADLVRAQLPGYPQVANFALLDWYGSLDPIQVFDRAPGVECPICRNQRASFHDKFNGRTRYRHLFHL